MIRVLGCCLTLLGGWAVTTLAVAMPTSNWTAKVDSSVLQPPANQPLTDEIDFIVFLAEQADLSGAARLGTKLEKGTFVFQKLTEVASRSQPAVLQALEQHGVTYQSFWIANMIRVRGSMAAVQAMAERSDVARVHANPLVHFPEPASPPQMRPSDISAIEANISKIKAPDVWALGYTGQGIVVGGADTGYRWDHAALKGKYRGWNGSVADHNYNWHDAIHSAGGTCGPNTLQPCDDHGHGTHTMGIMVGDDAAGNQVGVAPGAKWIGCRNMNHQGAGTPTTYTECFQWFIAPTNSNGNSPDPAKAPDIINNSWYCPASEGCIDPNMLKTVVENVRAAGIAVVTVAGNDGASGCSSIEHAPTIYDASFTVGSTDSNDAIATTSSRGPVTSDGSGRLKPNVTAPGVSIRSTTRTSTTSYGTMSGTSMAAPHVVGAAALLLSAHPGLAGDVAGIETLLEQTAVPLTSTQNCGVVPGTQIPNNTFGWGRINALAALGLDDSDGDGMQDWQEILAGTDQNNPLSLLRISGIVRSGAEYLISFTTVNGKNYRLERNAIPSASGWMTVADNIPGTGSIVQVPDPNGAAATERFYHIVLLP